MNIMIVGVGGQGTLLASRILGKVAIKEGYDVKVSEVHGMSQRGGSVVTYVKYSDKVYSPIIDRGEADLILAFEMLEAMRALPYLKKGGKMIANTQKMNPMPVIIGVSFLIYRIGQGLYTLARFGCHQLIQLRILRELICKRYKRTADLNQSVSCVNIRDI